MGAKAPSKLKLRRPTYKCDECPKKFLSTQALKTHQYCVHKIKANKKPIKAKGKLTALLGKAVKKEEVKVVKNVIERKLPVRKKSSVLGDVEEAPPVSDVRKIEFECPQCSKMFGAYFAALRHIQKFHYVNGTPLNSPDPIKPLRVELCVKCDIRIQNNDVHICPGPMGITLMGITYVCTGCKQRFSSTPLFDLHVAGLHCDNVDSLFFSISSDFFTWKEHMESVTKIKYLIMAKCNSKQTYRCTYSATKEDDEFVAHLCPSSIVVREYSKGTQVHFYKEHYGHTCPQYAIPDMYKKNSITTLMQQSMKADSDLFDNTDEKDLYVQFKTLMDSIVLEAAKLNISTLKILVGKALEMTPVLNSYDEDESENIPKNTVNRSMSDDQISKALETFKNTHKLRVQTPRLRVKTIPEVNKLNTPKILNTFSLVEEVKKEVEPPPPLIKAGPTPAKQVKRVHIQEKVTGNESVNIASKDEKQTLTQAVLSPASVSFNDTYRDFVDKNFKMQKEIEKVRKMGNGQASKNEQSKTEIEIQKTTPAKKEILRSILAKKEMPRSTPAKKEIQRNTPAKNEIQRSTPAKNEIQKSTPANEILRSTTANIEIQKSTPAKKEIQRSTPAKNEIQRSSPVNKEIQRSTPAKNEIQGTTPAKRETQRSTPAKKEIQKSTAVKKEIQKSTFMKKLRTANGKKQIVKTKIGQFKPSLSPKKIDIAEKRESISSIGSGVKKDFVYEVKEQENDCNILILKI